MSRPMKERMMDMKQKILTAREKEIFEKLIQNYSTKEIANSFHISEKNRSESYFECHAKIRSQRKS